jgi:Flp pilus assembly protein TadG
MWLRRERDQRGAVAVEAALITPFLCLLLFGIIEMSLLMRDAVSVNSSVRVGARIASVSASSGKGTCAASSNPPPCSPATVPALAQAAADAIQKAGSAMPKDSIQWVMIYQAGTNGYPVGQTDLTCGTNCVTYVWDKVLDKFRYASGSWDSSTINACVNDPNAQAVGVALRANHTWITGLFGSGVAIAERSVMQFEPLPNEQCLPGKHP